MTPTNPTLRNSLFGVATIAILILIIRFCLGLFTLEFEDNRPVIVHADRSGLLLETNAAVKYHGITVGRISKISLRHGGASIELAIQPRQLPKIPADVKARIVPTTLLGSKYIELTDSSSPSETPLAAGAVIDDVQNTAELNETFDRLADVLTALKPAEVSSLLHALNADLDGNGQNLNLILDDLGTILPELNDRSGQIDTTLNSMPKVVNGYATLTDPLVATMVNAGALSRLLDSRANEFEELLDSVTDAGLNVGETLDNLAPWLGAALSTLRPTLELLDNFRKLIPCLLRGHVEFGKRARAVFGGPNKGGTHRNGHVTLSLVRSQPAYEYPTNLPKVGAQGKPNCHGLPLPESQPPFTSYDIGANPYPKVTDQPSLPETPLGVWLFGNQLSLTGKH